jgi:hypothetical protein
MGFLKKIFDPEPPKVIQQPVEETPSYEDEQRDLEQRRILEDQERKRKGRRSTILTGSRGLNDIEDDEINKRTLLGG